MKIKLLTIKALLTADRSWNRVKLNFLYALSARQLRNQKLIN